MINVWKILLKSFAAYAYVKYFTYLFKHKWYVFIACCRMGIIWRGIKHDWSKFLPSEFVHYANWYYRVNQSKDCVEYRRKYQMALLKHFNRNDHHWEYWMLPISNKNCTVFKMPTPAIKEMVADWIGASKAKKTGVSARIWYLQRKNNICLAPSSKKILIKLLAKEWII
jgi:hypothetical protein